MTTRSCSAWLQARGPTSVATTMPRSGPEATGEVDARLHRKGVAGDEWRSGCPRPCTGSSCSSIPIPCPIRWMNVAPYPARGDRSTSGPVDRLAGGSDRGRGHGRAPAAAQPRKARENSGLGLARDDRAGDVRAVPNSPRRDAKIPKVTDDDLVATDLARAGHMVRAGRVRPASDNGEVHTVVPGVRSRSRESRLRPRPRSAR